MQFIDLSAQYQALKPKIDARIEAVLAHNQFIMGPEVAEFERAVCEFTGRRHCVSCANGTDALQLLYMAWGIGEGDAVFCPNVTFIASVEPAVMLGATPVLCDITPDTYNLCPVALERQIKSVLQEGRLAPKVVVAVDFLGNPADHKAIADICDRYGLLHLEDMAQSFGALLSGTPCGSFGAAASLSFFPSKPLGCYGDGGGIVTDDDNLAELLRSLRVHGKGPRGKYDNVRIGTNSRLDTLQAAIMLPKLCAVREYEMDARQQIAKRYNDAFSDRFVTPFVADDCVSSYAQYALLASDTVQRDALLSRLNAAEIPHMIYYPTPQHLLPVFANTPLYGETFPHAVSYCERTFSLPFHPYLSVQEQDAIIATVLAER